MKLKRLRLPEGYRSLPRGFEIEFFPQLGSESVDPLCVVGANGSGKSNLLEVLADIFYYYDAYKIGYAKSDDFKEPIGSFEIDYYLPFEFIRGISHITREPESGYILVSVTKRTDYYPVIQAKDGEYFYPPVSNQYLLPRKIWGYSSGENEILSVPFLKMDILYFKELIENNKKGVSEIIETNRLDYINYNSASLVLLSNFIAFFSHERDASEKLKIFEDYFHIEELVSFKINIRRSYWNKRNIKFSREIEKFIEILIETFNPELQEDDSFLLEVSFEDAEKINRLRALSVGAMGLYKILKELDYANLYVISHDRRSEVLSTPDYFYVQENLPFAPNDKLPFLINNIKVKVKGTDNIIDYKTLSDGEHQALTVIGTLNMIDENGQLFLFDEPETHLNPQWKYAYLNKIQEIVKNPFNQIILTTHDPIFISGLSKEEVIVFNRSDTSDNEKYYYPEEDLKGMGVEAILTSEIFGLNTTLDKETLSEIIERRKLLIEKEKNQLTEEGAQRLTVLNNLLDQIDFNLPFDDPLYRDFVMAIENIETYDASFISKQTMELRNQDSSSIMERLLKDGF